MRPLLLHLQNFGPFLDETIDFTNIKLNQLFLISGKTGSGKTMIFDSIVYALYGRASTEKREVKHLRSHFANPNEPLTVTFEFEIQNQRYKVIRKASFLKEGNKNETKPQLDIYHFENGAFQLKESKVSSGEKYLLELLGLKQHQFRQLFILPQGEFKTFLFSNSSEKQTILRTLFNTQLYDQLKNQLTDQTEITKKEIERQHMKLESLWQELYTLDDEALTEIQQQPTQQYELILKYLPKFSELGLKKIQELRQEKEKLTETYNQLKQDILRQEKRQESVHRYNDLKLKLQQLKEQEKTMTLYEKKLELIQKSKLALRIYEELEHTQKILFEKEEQLEYLQKNIKETKHILNQNKEKYDEHMNQKSQYERYSQFCDQTQHYYRNIESFKTKFEASVLVASQISQIDQKIENQQSKVEQLYEQKGNQNPDYNYINQLHEKFYESQSILKDLKESQKKYEKREALEYQCKQNEDRLKQIRDEIEHCNHEYNELSETDTTILTYEETIIALRQSLHHGASCPVCGTTVSDELQGKTLEDLKSQYDYNKKIKKKREQLVEKAIQIESQLEMMHDQIEELKHVSDNAEHINQLEESILDINQSIKNAQQKAEKIEQLNQKLKEMEQSIVDLQNEKMIKEQELHHIQDAVNQFQTNTGCKEIESFIQIYQKYETYVQSFSTKKEKLENDINENKQHFKQISYQLDVNQSQIKDDTKRKIQLETELHDELEHLNINHINEIKEIKVESQNEEHYQVAVDQFKQSLHVVSTQLEDEKCIFNAIEPVDLMTLNDSANQLQHRIDEKQKQYNEINFQNKNNQKVVQKIVDLIDQLKETLSNQIEIVTLADVISGKNNHNLTLENYVLIYYLELILIEANKHFRNMTGQRYELIRKKRKGRGFSGLELEVFDYYSNQSRHIASLSGGETFQASLALALGLSEIVQREQGGVSLDSMFIDEGFGTLDQETLETAINTLVQLQSSGRLVGIISHVSELKNRMPVILEVKSKNYESYTQINFND
ncbi:exonuclease subunit SbcC [Staphylococcus felis]|uniref:exonuclease subunit SbcC n=1 Tax=Staphylococcus felis TaxID=46127 RepID=UPI0039678EF9